MHRKCILGNFITFWTLQTELQSKDSTTFLHTYKKEHFGKHTPLSLNSNGQHWNIHITMPKQRAGGWDMALHCWKPSAGFLDEDGNCTSQQLGEEHTNLSQISASPDKAIAETSGTTMRVPVKSQRSPAWAVSTASALSTTSTLRGIEPRGSSACVSWIRTCRQGEGFLSCLVVRWIHSLSGKTVLHLCDLTSIYTILFYTTRESGQITMPITFNSHLL